MTRDVSIWHAIDKANKLHVHVCAQLCEGTCREIYVRMNVVSLCVHVHVEITLMSPEFAFRWLLHGTWCLYICENVNCFTLFFFKSVSPALAGELNYIYISLIIFITSNKADYTRMQ